ncbi:MAG: hypothetical protein ACW97Z_09150 [Candidatus Hodarchaeales archaeon]|jgi:hypothetical protein
MEIGKELTVNITYLGAAILGLMGIIIIIAHFNDVELPFISNDRGAFVAISIIGFIMCTLVMGHAIESYGWIDPAVLISSIIGGIIVILIGLILFNIDLPILSNGRNSFLLLITLVGTKVLLTNVQRIFDIFGIIS